ncbi:flagellar biosynthesis protein FlhB [Aquabacterium sp. A08]|uniref:EscU/YscU/HrcU family type III secretion system export apparatus switch protein n=1 Tax=Aquabacterium sp. A08 TaxID=2718532 RepID=UPI001420F35C|nr:flagellar type III secretion system protein FlhB [Aquabacterium sp. A08]NIC40242.1 flagellar biosynthesis protein FlhB [Aquabacterium sp. A08]
MDSSTQDKNLPATPQRLKKAREDGQVPRSRDLSHLAVLGGGLLTLSVLVPWGYERLRQAMRLSLSFDRDTVRHPEAVLEVLARALTEALVFFLPLGLVVAAVAVLAMVASGSYAYSVKPLVPDFSKIGVLSGFKRLFSRQQFFEVLKLTAITVLLALVAAYFVSSHLLEFGTLLMRPLESSMSQLGEWFGVGVGGLLAVVALIAVIDVPLQQYLHANKLKMSLKEVKDEHKESEGNPQLKGKLRQRQREIAQGNSVARVPAADLVVMNPTHYAVALKYDEKTMAAPHVIAKGADLVALRIRDMAQDSQVPVLESPMLARALYAHTEIDQQVPAALFTAVAQVLAYVYRLRAALRGEGAMPREVPQPDVPVELDPHHGRTAPAP